MNKKKAIYIVGAITLPDLDAGALRVLHFSELFKEFFDTVIIASRSDIKEHDFYDYDEKIKFLPYHKPTFHGFRDKFITLFKPEELFINDLLKCIDLFNLTHILIYSVLPKSAIKSIRKIAKEKNIKIIFDVVEFQTISRQTLTTYFSFYRPNKYLNNHCIKKNDNVIAISSFLENRFRKKGCNVVRIPFVLDMKSIEFSIERDKEAKVLEIIYAGNPKKQKDSLANIIRGIDLLPKSSKKQLVLRVCGLSLDEFLAVNHGFKNICLRNSGQIKFLGKLERQHIEKLYHTADFSVLLRNPKNRTSMAGFPTKITESLAHGVPIICNLSSDLNKYLVDGSNCILVNNETSREFAKQLVNALKISDNELSNMKENARQTAEAKLDVFLYRNEITNILK